MNLLAKFLGAVLIVGCFYAIASAFRKSGYPRLLELARKSKWRADDVILPVLQTHGFLWIMLLGLYCGALVLLNQPLMENASRLLKIAFIISFTFAIARIASLLVKTYADKLQTTVAMSGLTQNISRSVIFVLGGLMILNSLGISITPLLTTLGIGGLAVALALQDTLSNFFSGFHIILAKQIKIGDYVKLDTGEEGYIVDITWRSTKIRMLPNNVVLIPNSKLAQAIVTNFYLPEKEMAVLVQVGVHYKSDLARVEKVTVEVGREVMKEVAGGVPEFDPFTRYHTFDSSSINFTVILRAKEFVDQYLIKHEFIKRLHARYNKEGIAIPFPIRALNLDQEGADKLLQREQQD